MDYQIHLSNIVLSDSQRSMLDTRVALGLSRFANLIDNFDISLNKRSSAGKESAVLCKITIHLLAGYKIEVSDRANTTDAVLEVTIQRVKRAIERHLKHHRGARLGSSMTSRT